MITKITGPLKEPLEYLATQINDKQGLVNWSNLIHDFLKERIKIPKNETYVLKLAEHLTDNQRELFYKTVIQHARNNWPSITITESKNEETL